ncbi:DUF1853 family protein [Opitutia bacterium ISCC 51]|nr:DUF1853 family protein [Opitutae bacterium ISCC 51]QXD29187.1 DUF1853 family protein [Opitutae bacterium ISCC 52]
MNTISQALLQSFIDGPLLIGDLPEAPTFPYQQLALPINSPELNTKQKLGHLCEDAFALLIAASTKYELLEQNLQLQKDVHTTVGELDFLLREKSSGQLIHLELATKFYLSVETEDDLKLPGPDPRDNFFKKLEHLRSHQLVLSTKFRSALPEVYRKEPIQSQQLMYGCLFDHVTSQQAASASFINPLCRRGRWLGIDECEAHFSPQTQFQRIPKSLWPASPSELADEDLEPWTPQCAVDRCVMVRIIHEPIPYFITPSNWPIGHS